MEALDTLLGRLAAHLLRFILDDDGIVCRNDIDGATTAKLVTLGVHDASLFGAAALLQGGIEGLHVDDHHVDVGTCREAVDLAEARAVVHEVADCLAVLLEEVLLGVLERLVNALANGDGGYHHNELGPAVEAVKFEYGLGIDVGLARARLHLDIDIDGRRTLGKYSRLGKLIDSLLFTNVVEKSVSPNCKRCIGVAFARFELALETWKHVASISPYHTAEIAQVEGRAQIGLTGKDIRHRPGGSRLIRLNLELELHEDSKSGEDSRRDTISSQPTLVGRTQLTGYRLTRAPAGANAPSDADDHPHDKEPPNEPLPVIYALVESTSPDR